VHVVIGGGALTVDRAVRGSRATAILFKTVARKTSEVERLSIKHRRNIGGIDILSFVLFVNCADTSQLYKTAVSYYLLLLYGHLIFY